MVALAQWCDNGNCKEAMREEGKKREKKSEEGKEERE